MADISTAVSMARVPILGEDGRISDDYIPAAIGENVTKAEAAATRAETAATDAEGSESAASQSATQASSSASAAKSSENAAAESAATAAESATEAAASAKTASQKADAVLDHYISSAQATTLEPGSQATASVADQVLTIGVPKGDKGDAAEAPSYDAESGEYVGLGGMFASMRDFRLYTIRVPKGLTTACVKADSNAGIAVPVPGTSSVPASDPYATLPAFYHIDVNATVDAEGFPHVHAIKGDGRFRSDGSNGDVFVMCPPLWWSHDESGEEYTDVSISNTPLDGLSPQPGMMLPDGNLREVMLYAKYPLCSASSPANSCSGQQPRTRDVSHNSLITKLSTASSGKAGKTMDFTWYVDVMFLLKYATKNSQSVFQGCVTYDITQQPTAGTTSGRDVTVATGHGFVEGSAIMVGTANTDRGDATAHDVVDYAVIESITGGDGSSTLHLDREVTVTTAHYIKTAPWPTGACDLVQGDGSPTSSTFGKEPFSLQGIELAHGMYEVMSGVGLKSTGSGWQVMVLYDTASEASNLNGYEETGVYIPSESSKGWRYPLRLTDAGGMIVGTGSGGSTSTGTCDGSFSHASTATGEREFHSLGSLGHHADAGLFCVSSDHALSASGWLVGSRLSVNGRSRGEAA